MSREGPGEELQPLSGGRSMISKEKQEAILRHFISYQTTRCKSKLDRYHETGQPPYLDEAIQISRASLNMPRHPVKEPSLLMVLSESLFDRYVVMGRAADLREAISAAGLAVTAIPEDNPNLPAYIRHLAVALDRVYNPTGPSNYLEQGWEPALLAERFHTIYERNGVVALLQEAIRLALVAVAATPEGHHKRPGRLNILGTLLFTRFRRFGAWEDLQEAIRLSEEAVAATPMGHPDRPGRLSNLGHRLSTRFHRTGALEDSQEALRRSREAVATIPVGHPDRPMMLDNLGNHLSTRFDRTGVMEELQEAIDRGEEAVAATPVGHPDRALMLNNLGYHLSNRFFQTGELGDSGEAIRRGREAVDATPVGHPDRPLMLENLGNHLSTRFYRTGVMEELQEAIDRGEEAVAATPVDHPDRARMLTNLGAHLAIRYHHTGELEDLEAGILRVEEGVAATPANHPDRARRLNNLGYQLSSRFHRTGALEDLQEAIRWGSEAVATTPVDHPYRAGRLTILGNHLSTRFERTGALEDLQEGIRLSEEAVAAIPVGHPYRIMMLSNLGEHLSTRFNRTGALEDLQEAIRRSEEAVAATPVDHPDRGGRLNNLGNYLSTRFSRTKALGDLDEAIRQSEKAVAATPVDHPDRARWLANLGAHLSTRFGQTGALEDLQEAIRRGEEAVAKTPLDHPDRSRRLSNLGNHLSTRFHQTGALEDLQNAIRRSEEAVATTPVDHPNRAWWLNILGTQLLTRFDQSRNADDYESACTAWETAAESNIAHPVVCARSAHSATLAQIESGHLKAAYSNSQSAVKLLHRASSRAIAREDQEYILGQVSGSSSLAASLALEAGEPANTALEFLELGCGIIAGYTLDARNDVSELSKEYPALCSRYKALQDELSSPLQVPDMESHVIPSMTSTGNRVTRRLEAIRELDELEAEIRCKDGFSRFQLPPPSGDFITLARSIGGPIVAFSVSKLRSDAILVTQTEIKALSLPGLDYQTLQEKSGILSNSVKGPKRTMLDRLNILKGILLWLWKATVKPVLEELNFIQDISKNDGEPLPRIWWISSGRMGMMPIHAAGDYASNPKIITSNYVISSYTPTIKSLAYARRKASEVQRQPGNNVLIIGNSRGAPSAPNKRVLNEVPAEMKAIKQIAQGAIGTTCTIPHPPSKKAVLDNLSSCNIAHFACHGVSMPTNPCNSHLLLLGPGGTEADPLRIKELSNRNLERSMLAYLSACHTANYTSETLLDEAIHIASGFQLAGFPHVIGTLWEASDLKAREVATEFYNNLFDSLDSGQGFEDGIVVEALHKAVASLREECEDNPILWAPFIHLGA